MYINLRLASPLDFYQDIYPFIRNLNSSEQERDRRTMNFHFHNSNTHCHAGKIDENISYIGSIEASVPAAAATIKEQLLRELRKYIQQAVCGLNSQRDILSWQKYHIFAMNKLLLLNEQVHVLGKMVKVSPRRDFLQESDNSNTQRHVRVWKIVDTFSFFLSLLKREN